jgi:hypothetical protein
MRISILILITVFMCLAGFPVYPVETADSSKELKITDQDRIDPYPVFSNDIRDIMWESATRIGMDFGYDSSVALYCFFKSNMGNPEMKTDKNDKKPSSAEFEKYLNSISTDKVWEIYSKINGNIAGAQYLQRYYKRNKTWKYVNYMNKTVLPTTLSYMKQLEDYMRKNSALSDKLKKGESEIVQSRIRAVLSQKNRLGVVDEFQ